VFEGERAYGGVIFKSREHTERLHASARALGFEIPWSADEIDRVKDEAIAKNGLTDAYVRPIAWRGSEMMGVSAQTNTIHLAIAVWEWGAYYGDAKLKGARLDMAEWKRPSPGDHPLQGQGGGALHDLHALQARGGGQGLFRRDHALDYRGYVAEATGANVFFVKDGVVHTPLPDCFLDGITRRTAIDLLRARGVR
jgi:branched-chain amino acid aminotransferase